MNVDITDLKTVRLSQDGSAVIILDQTCLPGSEVYVSLSSAEEIWEAIYRLKVRGAPAIGIAAAYGIYVCSRQIAANTYGGFCSEFLRIKDYLASSRPTAVNLVAALDRMEKVVLSNSDQSVEKILELLKQECKAIHEEDIAMCKAISEYGLTLIKDGDGILTHCNAGPLATSRYGTALGPLFLGKEKGMNFKVFSDETRPLLQGARLTSFELCKAGIDVTLICDNMASIVMKNGWVQACFVGCDRVAANGDTANKIGTLLLAIAAKRYNVPFYVCAPSSTIDFNSKTGADIVIEQRDFEEVTSMWFKKPMAPEDINVYNPAFDVTDADLITAIITENGIAYAPFEDSLRDLVED